MEKVNLWIKIFMIVLYLLFAAGIWWSPILRHSTTEIKAAISILFVLYAGVRLMRLIRQKQEPAD